MAEEKEPKWCRCNEFPEKMCDSWPACVDINGKIWGAEPQFQKYRKRNWKKVVDKQKK